MVKIRELASNPYDATVWGHSTQIHITAAQQNRKRKNESEKSDQNKRRKMATEREKKRMEKVNTCIDEIKEMVCPDLKTSTKAKVLSFAIDRIQYLENLTKELLSKKNSISSNVELFDQIIKPPSKSGGIKCEPNANQDKIISHGTSVLENVSTEYTHKSKINHGFDQDNMQDVSYNYDNMNQIDLNFHSMYSPESLPAPELLQLHEVSNQGYATFENYGTQAENFINLFEDSFDGQSYFQEESIDSQFPDTFMTKL